MIIKNVTQEQLELSLEKLNELYNDPCFERDWEIRRIITNEGNIIWNRYEQKGKRFHVTLMCRSRFASGHRTHNKPFGDIKEGFTRSKSACWHVHGDWFDILIAINENAVINTAGRKVSIEGGNWENWNVGSMMHPQYFSDACECGTCYENFPKSSDLSYDLKDPMHHHKVGFVQNELYEGQVTE